VPTALSSSGLREQSVVCVRKVQHARVEPSREEKNPRKKDGKLTSRHDPNPPPRNRKLIRRRLAPLRPNLNHDFPLVHEKHHLHFAAILRALETCRRDLDEARAEEGEGEDLGVFEFAAGDVVGDDAVVGES